MFKNGTYIQLITQTHIFLKSILINNVERKKKGKKEKSFKSEYCSPTKTLRITELVRSLQVQPFSHHIGRPFLTLGKIFKNQQTLLKHLCPMSYYINFKRKNTL